MPTYLDAIVDHHRRRADADTRPLEALVERARDLPPGRSFEAALRAPLAVGDRVRVIAEVKRRSPSKPALHPDLLPAPLAAAYEQGGASCLSVLTDQPHFGALATDLPEARGATALPTLRKDFTVWGGDVADARLMGADAVLLIAAVLDDAELAALADLARDLSLDALVEVHDEEEAKRAVAVGATMIGVNQRDLVTFEVDTARAERVAASLPDGVVRVAESGVSGPRAAMRLADAGYHAVLVGETLVRAVDPAAMVRALRTGEAEPGAVQA